MTNHNPYAAPRSEVAPPKEGLPRTLAFALHAAIGLKAVQLLVTLWLQLLWSAFDVGLHLGAAFLILRGRRSAIVPWLLAATWGLLVSLRDGRVVPARFLYLVVLPLTLTVLTLRHWRSFDKKTEAPEQDPGASRS